MTQDTDITLTTTQSEVLDYVTGAYQLDPVSLRRVFLLLLRNHYASPDTNFGNVPDVFKKFRYSDIDAERVLNVDLDYLFPSHNIGKCPAVYVGVGDIQLDNVQVLDKFAGYSEDRSITKSSDTAVTTVEVIHRTESPDEALALGMVTLSFLKGMRQVLQRKLGLHAMLVSGLSKPHLVKGTDGNEEQEYQAGVSARIAFPADWETNIESHRLKKVSFDLGTGV